MTYHLAQDSVVMGEGLREGEEGSRPAPGECALEEEVENEGPGRLHAVLYHHHPRRGAHRLAQEVSPSVLLHGRLGKHPSPESETAAAAAKEFEQNREASTHRVRTRIGRGYSGVSSCMIRFGRLDQAKLVTNLVAVR